MSRHCLDTVKAFDIYVSNCSFSRICNTMHIDSIIINKINRNLPVVKLYKIYPNYSWLTNASSADLRSLENQHIAKTCEISQGNTTIIRQT